MRLFFAIGLMLLATGTSAEVFKWTDAQGKVHFGDDPPLNGNAAEVEVEINSYTQVTIEPARLEALTSRPKPREVVMYSTSWCGYCKKAREYFQANHIPYKDNDIEMSARAKREYDALQGSGVPVILVGKSRMNGFSEQGFNKIYK